jgi:hypothetical protein
MINQPSSCDTPTDTEEANLAYWKQRRTGAGSIQLSVERIAIAKPGRLVPYHFTIPHSDASNLKTSSRSEPLRTLSLRLAVFAIFLQRYSGQDDLVIASRSTGANNGTRAADRFLETVYFRIDLTRGPIFQGLVVNVGRIVNAADAEPRTSQLMCEMEDWTPGISKEVRFDSSVIATSGAARPNRLRSTGQMAPSFNASFEEIIRMARDLTDLLTGVHPQARMSQLEPLGTQEEREIVAARNGSSIAEVWDCIHRKFESRVERSPAAPAVACGAERSNYQVLNKRAHHGARFLRRNAVGPERFGIELSGESFGDRATIPEQVQDFVQGFDPMTGPPARRAV